MPVSRLLSGTALLTTLAALMPSPVSAAPLPSFVNIDESVEGATPTVTSNLSLTGVTVTPFTVTSGEAWTISFTIPGGSSSITGGEGGLLEPGTNKVSDSLILDTFVGSVTGTGNTFVSFSLFSDDENGNIANSCSGCTFLTEDGTFQFMNTTINPFVGPDIQVFLKSDIDPVPEPGPLSLLAGGLGALWWLRRRKKNSFL